MNVVQALRSFVTLRMTAKRKTRKQRHSVSFRAQSRNPLEADQGNSVYNAPTARRSFVTLRMTAKRKTRETKTKTNN